MKTEMEKKRNKYLLVILLITVIFYVCIAFDLKVPAPAVAGLKDPAPAVVSEASGESKNEYKVDRTVFDFRRTSWGMSREEVNANEVDEAISVIPGGVEVKVIYFYRADTFENFYGYDFVKDKLVLSTQTVIPDNPEDYIAYFNSMKESSISEYGKPVEVDPLDIFWVTPRTIIRLVLKENKGRVSLVIKYISQDLAEWAAKTIEEYKANN